MTATPQFVPWVEPLAKSYRENRDEVLALVRSLGDSDLARPAGDEGWSVRDEVAHMAGSDPDFLRVLGAIVAGETPDTSIFADIDARNVRNLEAWGGRPMEAIATALEDNGRVSQGLLAKLTNADETRQPGGFPFPIRGLIEGYSMHGAYHLGQIQKALR